ncbi:MAG TPA: AEC family transporter, partial [Anaerolineae bacterium]|nr:AEC family transporter [Anaerolineae bacterium]
CVTALNYYTSHSQVDWRKTLRSIAANPLILACLVGILLNGSGLGLPLGTGEILSLLSRAALPLGLLIVGADLNLGQLGTSTPGLLLASALKLALYPLFVGLWCWSFGVEGQTLGVAMLFGALPTATSAYVLALELGGDAPLMAAIITGQTAAAVITMPLLLFWLSG